MEKVLTGGSDRSEPQVKNVKVYDQKLQLVYSGSLDKKVELKSAPLEDILRRCSLLFSHHDAAYYLIKS